MAEAVNHPTHYNSNPSGVECIDIVEQLNFNIGNSVKYLWRTDDKGSPIEDLEKAAWYLIREIHRANLAGDTWTMPTWSVDPTSIAEHMNFRVGFALVLILTSSDAADLEQAVQNIEAEIDRRKGASAPAKKRAPKKVKLAAPEKAPEPAIEPDAVAAVEREDEPDPDEATPEAEPASQQEAEDPPASDGPDESEDAAGDNPDDEDQSTVNDTDDDSVEADEPEQEENKPKRRSKPAPAASQDDADDDDW